MNLEFQILNLCESVAYQRGGMGGGSGPPHFSKSWSSRFPRKCDKIGGGGGSGRSVKKWSLRFLKASKKLFFKGWEQDFGFVEMLKLCWKRHSKPK